MAASSIERSGWAASIWLTIAVSEVSPAGAWAIFASSVVLTRLPLWASAIVVPNSEDRSTGCAFSQVEAPVVL